MEYQEQLQRKRFSRKDMMKRVARFSTLKGFDGGLPDSDMPGACPNRVLANLPGPLPDRLPVARSSKRSRT